MTQYITTNEQDSVFTISFNRPDKRNAMHFPMIRQFDEAVDAANRSETARVVVLQGCNGIFSAGIDVTNLMMLAQEYGANWMTRMRRVTDDLQAIFTRFERLELPTIAKLEGYCLGLGLELALAADIRVMAEGCQWGLPETRLGIIPDVGGTTRLLRVVGPSRAKEVIFTGKRYEAQLAADWGVVNYLVAADALDGTIGDISAEIIKSAPLAVGMAKRVIDGMSDIDRGLQLEGWAQSQLMQTEDFTEAAQAFMMRRTPQFKGK